MSRLFSFLFLTAFFLFLFRVYGVYFINQSRKQGGYPSKKSATMFDVRRLIIKGEKELAVTLYCQIFRSSRRDAIKAVNELEKSIQQKGIESE